MTLLITGESQWLQSRRRSDRTSLISRTLSFFCDVASPPKLPRDAVRLRFSPLFIAAMLAENGMLDQFKVILTHLSAAPAVLERRLGLNPPSDFDNEIGPDLLSPLFSERSAPSGQLCRNIQRAIATARSSPGVETPFIVTDLVPNRFVSVSGAGSSSGFLRRKCGSVVVGCSGTSSLHICPPNKCHS